MVIGSKKIVWYLPMKGVISDTVVNHIPHLIFIQCARNSVQSQRMFMHSLLFTKCINELYVEDVFVRN
jgi:hypothetical protein